MVLAFDLGLKRTGVASGQALTGSATPCGLLTASRGRLDWSKVDALIQEWQPKTIVIGDPQSDDPHLAKLVNRFKSHIQQQHKIPIVEVDERLTSVAANAELSQQRLSTERKIELRDQVAACLILESYFRSLSPSSL
ncbi:putative Holliday junction resolvase [Arenicella xantha]|uniref:Putative pre-16S rRNA nuclease n=2 Tax=Arenicella xantha TaxID=644221 RepID=A0A395JI10_9GAMM|nr:putative Holliday junction resolvase [Arenicella xantha]